MLLLERYHQNCKACFGRLSVNGLNQIWLVIILSIIYFIFTISPCFQEPLLFFNCHLHLWKSTHSSIFPSSNIFLWRGGNKFSAETFYESKKRCRPSSEIVFLFRAHLRTLLLEKFKVYGCNVIDCKIYRKMKRRKYFEHNYK